MNTYATGEIVRWSNELWIVSESDEEHLLLLSVSHSNVSACITDAWPKESKNRQVKIVADNMLDFFTRMIQDVGKNFK